MIYEDTYKVQTNDPLSLNFYTYVSNNPLSYTDPSGHKQEMTAGGGIAEILKSYVGTRYYKK